MKPLPDAFRQGGFDLVLVQRHGDIAIYKKTKEWRSLVYEVIRVQKHNGYTVNGKYFPPAEHFPSSEQWGVYGFTCTTMARAEQKALELSYKHVKNGIPERHCDINYPNKIAIHGLPAHKEG